MRWSLSQLAEPSVGLTGRDLRLWTSGAGAIFARPSIGLAALLQPRFDLLQIPHHASRREIEAAREVAAFLHFVDRAVRKRHDQSEFMPSDGSW